MPQSLLFVFMSFLSARPLCLPSLDAAGPAYASVPEYGIEVQINEEQPEHTLEFFAVLECLEGSPIHHNLQHKRVLSVPSTCRIEQVRRPCFPLICSLSVTPLPSARGSGLPARVAFLVPSQCDGDVNEAERKTVVVLCCAVVDVAHPMYQHPLGPHVLRPPPSLPRARQADGTEMLQVPLGVCEQMALLRCKELKFVERGPVSGV